METKEERLERRRREKAEQVTYKLEREIALWDPNNIESLTSDPFKTLFVARVVSSIVFHLIRNHFKPFFLQNYDTSESKLRREFEMYGPIKKIIMIHDVDSNKPRGYAFIEYEHERDMHCKYFRRFPLESSPQRIGKPRQRSVGNANRSERFTMLVLCLKENVKNHGDTDKERKHFRKIFSKGFSVSLSNEFQLRIALSDTDKRIYLKVH